MATPLTVLIPCKNERDNIEPCIESARQVAAEVLVADSGSTDGSLEIARRLADRVIEREYIDSGNFKNWAIPQATHSWVLIIDADERLTPELASEIRGVLAQPISVAAFAIKRRNFFLGHPIDHGDWARDRVVRLMRRDECRYSTYTDHAEIDLAPSRVGCLQHRMIHYTAWNLNDYLIKMAHYAEQQAVLWQSQGRRQNLWHLTLNGPMRFLRGYVFRGGFRDGQIGFLIATLTAYYSFLKQLYFWQRSHGRSRQDVERMVRTERLAITQEFTSSSRPVLPAAPVR